MNERRLNIDAYYLNDGSLQKCALMLCQSRPAYLSKEKRKKKKRKCHIIHNDLGIMGSLTLHKLIDPDEHVSISMTPKHLSSTNQKSPSIYCCRSFAYCCRIACNSGRFTGLMRTVLIPDPTDSFWASALSRPVKAAMNVGRNEFCADWDMVFSRSSCSKRRIPRAASKPSITGIEMSRIC